MKKMIEMALSKLQDFLRDERGSAQKSLRLPVVGFVLLLTAGVLFLTPQEAWACKPPPYITSDCSFQLLSKCCDIDVGGGEVIRARYIRVFCPDGTGGYTVNEECGRCFSGGACPE